MCNHENREAAMVVLDPGTPERHGRDGVWCDPCLVPLIKALNGAGIRTTSSCCGHGRSLGGISLADGRWLVIAPDDEAWRRIDTTLAPGPTLAEVWDVGFEVGWEHCQDGNYGTDAKDDDTPNPYRTTEAEGGVR